MKYYRLLILFFLFLNFSFAQDSSKTINKELKHGIQFQIGSLLNLTNFNNYTFSYRYLFNNYTGIRIGLLTNINEEDYDITQQLDSIITNPPIKYNNYNLKLSIQYLHSLISYNSFNFILGGGPFISYSKNESYEEYLSSSYISKYENINKTVSYGLDIVLGVEYNLSENVKLSGEYGLTISNENSDIKNSQTNIYNDGSPNRIRKDEGERNAFRTRGLGVNFGISIFF
ncbi:MAG: outer membrane beta-barrel protein [Ignavibacterium sp.]|nr:outer membrane beta-barrel protein [Ignavibacterium sp.]